MYRCRQYSYLACKYAYFSVSQFEFDLIDLAITSLLANQPVAYESECARDRCQSAAVTPSYNLIFIVPVTKPLVDFIAVDR